MREYLLEEAVWLRDAYGRLREAWDVYSKRIDALVGGEAYRLYRFELPDGHPLRPAGPDGMCDRLTLTEDDVLVVRDERRTDETR